MFRHEQGALSLETMMPFLSHWMRTYSKDWVPTRARTGLVALCQRWLQESKYDFQPLEDEYATMVLHHLLHYGTETQYSSPSEAWHESVARVWRVFFQTDREWSFVISHGTPSTVPDFRLDWSPPMSKSLQAFHARNQTPSVTSYRVRPVPLQSEGQIRMAQWLGLEVIADHCVPTWRSLRSLAWEPVDCTNDGLFHYWFRWKSCLESFLGEVDVRMEVIHWPAGTWKFCAM
jgi:hypothetical protein